MITGISPAAAHASWKRVSKRANARPRLACGASRWTMLSKPRRPTAAAKLTATARPTPPATSPMKAASRPATVDRASAPASITSSRTARRSRGAMALPAIVASADMPTATANHAVPADCVAQPERQVEEDEPDRRAQHQHRHRRQLHADRVQLHPLGRLLGTGGDDVRWQPGRARQRHAEQRARVEQRPPALDRRHLEQRGRDDGDEPGEPGDHPELRVGLDQVGLGPHHRRDERLLGHEVGLLQHERGEHEREQRQLVDRQRHQHGQHDPAPRRRSG